MGGHLYVGGPWRWRICELGIFFNCFIVERIKIPRRQKMLYLFVVELFARLNGFRFVGRRRR